MEITKLRELLAEDQMAFLCSALEKTRDDAQMALNLLQGVEVEYEQVELPLVLAGGPVAGVEAPVDQGTPPEPVARQPGGPEPYRDTHMYAVLWYLRKVRGSSAIDVVAVGALMSVVRAKQALNALQKRALVVQVGSLWRAV